MSWRTSVKSFGAGQTAGFPSAAKRTLLVFFHITKRTVFCHTAPDKHPICKMRYVSAYLLALAGGNEHPKLEDLKNILGAVGVDTDVEAAKLVISRLEGKSIDEVIAEGSSSLVSVSGGGAPAAASAAPAGGESAPAAKEEAKPAKKEEKEESDDDMGFGLFD
ncbi:unnamed protein product [Cylicocyclus nassatus]|uniref:Large ribosomal subunit protein P2 n=1 Tax=Cylicocyclus nassatus TaxID=53992 RepID=A0AA36GZ76_CYLNA|nr:unnamed protein product [Cylicocyclus nassatus]